MFKLLSPRAPRVLAALAVPAPAVKAVALAPRLFGRKPAVILGVVLALAIVDAGAAYGSVGNLGRGADTAATPIFATQTTRLAAMYPGDSPQTISGNFDAAQDGSGHVSSVTVSVASVVAAPGAAAGVCGATDFTVTHAVMPVNRGLSPGNGLGAFTGATIQFNDKSTNQDRCKGASVNLAYAIG
jgi:Flp pilus assembly protein TadG